MTISDLVFGIFIGLILLIITVLIVVPILLIRRVFQYSTRYHRIMIPKTKLSSVYSNLKSGDIILFMTNVHQLYASSLIQSLYNHCAIIVDTHNGLCLYEAQMGENIIDPETMESIGSLKIGISKIPLLARLKCYAGNYYVMNLSRPLDTHRRDKLYNTLEYQYKTVNEYPPLPALIKSWITGVPSSAPHCYQFVADTLKTINLAPPELDTDFNVMTICNAVSTLHKYKLPDDYNYSPPMQIFYDIE
jgi:hypothetical protein